MIINFFKIRKNNAAVWPWACYRFIHHNEIGDGGLYFESHLAIVIQNREYMPENSVGNTLNNLQLIRHYDTEKNYGFFLEMHR